MTLSLTPEPSISPDDAPRFRLDLTAPDDGTFTDLVIRRESSLIRRQPFAGGPTSVAFDYEAPFGVPVTYRAEGSYLPTSTPDWTETWMDLTDWTGDTSDWSVSSGAAESLVSDAAIVRSASGTIQRVTVADPRLVRVELLSDSNAVVCSLQVDASKVTLTGTASAQATGGGSFSLLLSEGTVTASANDASWTLTRSYSGTPTKVRLVAAGEVYSAGLAWSSVDTPYGVWGDTSGNIFVATYAAGSNLVRKFNSSGIQVASWSTTGRPADIWGDTSGNIFVVDEPNKMVRKFDSTGTQTASWSTTGNPLGIWGDTSGNIFVTEQTNLLVRKFDSTGTQTASWSTTGRPADIWGDTSGNIFVIDSTNKLVRKFDSTGTELDTWSTVGFPQGIWGDTSGNIFVADVTNLLIRKFDSSGSEIDSWSSTGAGYGLWGDASGNIVIGDLDNNVVRTYSYGFTSVETVSVTPVITPVSYASTATATLNETRAWLIHPSQPSLSLCIDEKAWKDAGVNVSIESAQQTTRPLETSVFSPPGRTRSVVYPLGPRKAGSWTLTLHVASLTARDSVWDVLADGAPLLLQHPGWEWDLASGWYAVGDVTESRVVNPLGIPHRLLPLPLTPVESPPVALVPEWTYGDLLLAAPTYADVLADFPTYLDVLTGSST